MKFTFQPESRPLAGYTLKRGIARGGFGEVYYALSDAGKEVAVKLLQHNLDIELRGIQQCLNLRHPNLVAIFDVKTDADGDHWVVMEYIGGQTLEQVLQTQNGPLPIDQIERWLVGLTAGLGYLHDRGIVHRDVKPGNIFWDQGSIKLGDVGLSKFMSPSRRSAQTESVGTVYYMAPEVSYGKYGYEVDIYSVGVMLFEMLSGQLPFDGQSAGEILMKHLSEPPNLNLVPAPFRPMLAAALEKDPKKRTGSMGKLLNDFRQAKSGGPIPATPVRQAGFAGYPNVPAPGSPPASNASSERPRPAAGTQTVRVGVLATRLADFFGADPLYVQSRISRLPRIVGLIGAAYCLGLLLLLVVVGLANVFGGLLVIFIPLGAVVLWMSPSLRRKVRTLWVRVMGGTMPPPVAPPTPKSVAQVIVPPVPAPVAVPVAIPVRQVQQVRPAPPAQVPAVQLKRGSQRLAELSGSLAWSAVLSVLFGAGTGVLSPLFGDAGSLHPDLGKLGLFTITTLLSVWAMLTVSKLSPGTSVSPGFRRILTLSSGAFVGVVAWWLSRVLMVDLVTGTIKNGAFFQSLGRQPLMLDHEPTLLGFAVFFGLLFEVRRWWCHIYPQRPAMFSVAAVVLTVGFTSVLPFIFAFPWDWAVTWAAVICCVVQLSAVWIPIEQRSRQGLRGDREAD